MHSVRDTNHPPPPQRLLCAAMIIIIPRDDHDGDAGRAPYHRVCPVIMRCAYRATGFRPRGCKKPKKNKHRTKASEDARAHTHSHKKKKMYKK